MAEMWCRCAYPISPGSLSLAPPPAISAPLTSLSWPAPPNNRRDETEDAASGRVADLEELLAIAFGHVTPPTCCSIHTMDWRHLALCSLGHLRCMVLVNFHASLRRKCSAPARQDTEERERPRPYDLFVMEPQLSSRLISLAAYRRHPSLGRGGRRGRHLRLQRVTLWEDFHLQWSPKACFPPVLEPLLPYLADTEQTPAHAVAAAANSTPGRGVGSVLWDDGRERGAHALRRCGGVRAQRIFVA